MVIGTPVPATDVVVLGGGVVGTACAWRLAQRGLQVILVDPAPGSGASGVAAGMLAPVSEVQPGEEPLLRLGCHAAQGYPDFVRELELVSGLVTGYRRCGTLAVALTADDRARLAETRRLQAGLGLTVEALTGRRCRALEPTLDPGVSAGTLIPDDHQIDPRRLLEALRIAATTAGVVTVQDSGTPERVDEVLAGVRLASGALVRALRVVLATGAWARSVVPSVRPVKGQILRLRMPAGDHILRRTVRAVVHGRDVYLVPRENGELVVGATSEDVGLDQRVTAGAVHDLLQDARALVPGVSELEFTETAARCRPGTPDNLPLIGPSAVPGLILATGHHRNGVLLCGVTADAVTAALADGDVPAGPVRVCDPRRLEQPGTSTTGRDTTTVATAGRR
ncbi:glycine oxidase ThiO [Kineosporia sp. NBRC 101731]|uniref:glycine oxidase ThiO n=1 Tax=Kineosporia sp. NBRC 101731 TaxID=3032199 RepID=UPI0024A3276E|nr:glycine oxidase ThiO [Kineosporia sp. NBRC 101731]GLY29624.1 glycine oxidase ThiO [Kineosporia sp. NBRC 101731]